MDVSQSIKYRGHQINDAVQSNRVLTGVAVENVDYSDVQGIGYTEKRAAADGLHASDIYLGGRTIAMAGQIYEPTLPKLFDALHILRAIFSPTSAYQESPADRGFLPLEYSQPTEDKASFPTGVIPLYVNARPISVVRFTIVRDRQARNGKGPSALPWNVHLLCKDPRVYVDPGQNFPLTGATSTMQNGVATNRGDYETPLDIALNIPVAPTADKLFHLTGFNGIDMTITIKTGMPATVYRWFGDDRVLMTQDVHDPLHPGPLVLRMDLVTFNTLQRRPAVPASIDPPTKPFTVAFQYSSTQPLATGSWLAWSEAFA